MYAPSPKTTDPKTAFELDTTTYLRQGGMFTYKTAYLRGGNRTRLFAAICNFPRVNEELQLEQELPRQSDSKIGTT
jgi:hypothetical protein